MCPSKVRPYQINDPVPLHSLSTFTRQVPAQVSTDATSCPQASLAVYCTHISLCYIYATYHCVMQVHLLQLRVAPVSSVACQHAVMPHS